MNSEVQQLDVGMSGAVPKPALEAGLSPSPLTTKYRVGLALVALGMVLVAVSYLGMILALTWGVVYHFRHHGYMLHGDGLTALAYFGFGIGGPILAFFLVKPFFAGRLPEPNRFTLTPESDPDLFKLIARICHLAGVPLPSRVDVDCCVNATVSYRDGWRSIRNNDLVLTIGLPLAASLTTQEFAGVLAHEFGHFSQRAGMRLTYIVRSLSGWFARVVYERDIWDVILVRAAYGIDLRIGVFFHLFRLCVWLSRRVLWVLMHMSHAFSCFMLRQMEFDADTYETRLAGSEAFAQTVAKMESLNAASTLVNESMQESWMKRRLPDDLPAFIGYSLANVTPELRSKMEEAARQRSRLFATHPTDAARVEAARAMQQSGMIHDLEPASSLFKDFPGLSKAATRLLYEGTFELRISDKHLVSHLVGARDQQMKAEGETSLKDYFFGVRLKHRSVGMLALDQPNASVEMMVREISLARQSMEQAQAEVMKANREYEEAETLYQLGLDALVQSSQQATGRARAKMATLEPALATFEKHARVRLESGLRLLRCPEVAEKITDAAVLRAEAEKLGVVFDRLSRAFVPLQELLRNTKALEAAVRGCQEQSQSRAAVAQLRIAELAPLSQKLLAEIRPLVQGMPEPFESQGDTTLVDLVSPEVPTIDRINALLNFGRRYPECLLPLYDRVLGRLICLAMKVEEKVVVSAA